MEGADLALFQHVPFILNRRTFNSRIVLDAFTQARGIQLQCAMELTQLDLHFLISAQDYAASFCWSMYIPSIRRINRSAAFAAEFIPPFLAQYPHVTLTLSEMLSVEMYPAIRQNEIDLAIPIPMRSSSFNSDSGSLGEASGLLHALPLEVEDLYIVIAGSLLRAHFGGQYPARREEFLAGISVRDVAEIPMFLWSPASSVHEEILSHYIELGLRPLIRVQTSVPSNLLRLCVQGLGFFFCCPMVLKYLRAEQPQHFEALEIFPVKELRALRQSVLIYHKQKRLTKPLRDSIKIIQRNYRDH